MISGIELFGRHGAESVSTRALAEAAGVQMSAITYHFGNKEGLYRAVASYIAGEMAKQIEPALAAAGQLCGSEGGVTAARQAILSILDRLVTALMPDHMAPVARFVVREQMSPTPAFALLYGGVMERMLERISQLVNIVAGGGLDPVDARLRTIALIGQILVFRYARATVLAATGWEEVGPRQTAEVRQVILSHAEAQLAALQGSRS